MVKAPRAVSILQTWPFLPAYLKAPVRATNRPRLLLRVMAAVLVAAIAPAALPSGVARAAPPRIEDVEDSLAHDRPCDCFG